MRPRGVTFTTSAEHTASTTTRNHRIIMFCNPHSPSWLCRPPTSCHTAPLPLHYCAVPCEIGNAPTSAPEFPHTSLLAQPTIREP